MLNVVGLSVPLRCSHPYYACRLFSRTVVVSRSLVIHGFVFEHCCISLRFGAHLFQVKRVVSFANSRIVVSICDMSDGAIRHDHSRQIKARIAR